MVDIPRTKITAKEYTEQYPESMQPMELVDGEIAIMPTPKAIHQKIVLKLALLLSAVLDKLGEIVVSPADVHFDKHTVLQPDVFFVAADNINCKVAEDGWWHGAPDLCIEVVSPSSGKRDRIEKFELYEKYGVKEYWLVEQDGRYIVVFALENGQYKRHGVHEGEEEFTSSILPQLTVNVSDIFPEG